MGGVGGCVGGYGKEKGVEDRLWIGVVGVYVDAEGRQCSRGSYDVWLCGLSGKVCI